MAKERQQKKTDERRQRAASTPSTRRLSPAGHPLLQLQRAIGNRAVGGLLLALRDADENESQQSTPSSSATTKDEAAPASTAKDAVGPSLGGEAMRAIEAALVDGGSVGQPLPEEFRARMEERLGADLSDVRVHKEGAASEAARELGAAAFTRGQHIYFDEGSFQPGTARGQQLLAHELVHTIQQRSLPAPDLRSAASGFVVSSHDDASEQEARYASAQLVSHDASYSPAPAVAPLAHAGATPAPVVQRALDYDLETEPERAPAATPARGFDDDDEDLFNAERRRNFPLEVRTLERASEALESSPVVFIVPLEATREEVARRLFGSEMQARDLDFVPSGPLKNRAGNAARAVRVRRTDALTTEAARALRTQLDAELQEDVRWTVSKLSEWRIDKDDERELVERTAKWSQRSGWRDAHGKQYFDSFLDSLAAVSLPERGLFGQTPRNALERLLIETEEKSAYIQDLVGLRSTRQPFYAQTGQTLTPEQLITRGRKTSALPKGQTVGHYVKKDADVPAVTGATYISYITVREKLLDESTAERAEIAARNAPTREPRIVIPGDDGRFHVYTVYFDFFSEERAEYYRSEDAPKLLNYWWDYPVTAFIRGGEFQAEFPASGPAARQQRTEILSAALSRATGGDLAHLLNLDFDALSTATLDQRMQIFKLALASKKPSESETVDLLTRLVYATPNAQFAALERRMSAEGVTTELLKLNMGTNILAVIGRVFTEKTLAAMPVTVESLTNMETFELGEDTDGWFHVATSGGVPVNSSTVAAKDWNPASASRIGREPALAGEAAGDLKRTGIVFYKVQIKVPASHIPAPVKTREFLPTELVRLRIVGKEPRTQIVTALEAAGLLDINTGQLIKQAVLPFVKIYSYAFAATGLLRVFGGVVAEGLMAGGLRGGATALAEQAATKAGMSALFNAALLVSMDAVDAYRAELERTEEGRSFLSLYDVAMSMLIARDLYHLASSGIVGPLGRLARGLGRSMSTAGARIMQRLEAELEALQGAWSRLEQSGGLVAVEPATGARVYVPRDPAAFGQYLMAARAEVAGRRVITALQEAGRSTGEAEAFFKRLQRYAEDSKEIASAQRAIAKRAATMTPADAETYLKRLQEILDLRPASTRELAGFIHASSRARDPLAFLKEVEKLLNRKAITKDTLAVLGAKTVTGGLDLEWLNGTSLTDEQLNFLGKEPNTPWNRYRDVAAEITGTPPNYKRMPWARSVLRGAASELVAAKRINQALPGYAMSDWQVAMGSSLIDFEVTSTGGAARTHGLEVKGYTNKTWSESIEAYKLHRAHPEVAVDKDTRGLINKIERMLKQLKDAEAFTRTESFLAVTSDMSKKNLAELQTLLANNQLKTRIVTMDVNEVKAAANRLGEALGIPEQSKLPRVAKAAAEAAE